MATETRNAISDVNDHFYLFTSALFSLPGIHRLQKPGVFAPGIFPSDTEINNPPSAITRKISIGGAIC